MKDEGLVWHGVVWRAVRNLGAARKGLWVVFGDGLVGGVRRDDSDGFSSLNKIRFGITLQHRKPCV